jgi:hypothetical protein
VKLVSYLVSELILNPDRAQGRIRHGHGDKEQEWQAITK